MSAAPAAASYDGRYIAGATLAGGALGAGGFALFAPKQEAPIEEKHEQKFLEVVESRAQVKGKAAKFFSEPVVIASPALDHLGKNLSKRLGCPEYPAEAGETIYLNKFKSGDINTKFHWRRVVGRKVVMLFDTVNQERLFEQLCLLQALQGFAVPDSEDKSTKWKNYIHQGKYAWGRASEITVVLPWYRPCQMERTSRWQRDASGTWTNGDPNGEWLDVPTAQYYARLLSTPGSVPPLPGPSRAYDDMPLTPLWRPPLKLVFVELHEEAPIRHCVNDLNTNVRMVRYVPYFLDKFRAKKSYPGKARMYVLFPDKGAYDRYEEAVTDNLKLDPDHILFMAKVRVGDQTVQEQKLFFMKGGGEQGEKTEFSSDDQVLIIDDFTNSGGTLLGAVKLVKQKTAGPGISSVYIFVSHLVATYDAKVVEKLKKELHELGPQCKLFVTNSIPVTTNLLKDDPQVEICDLSDFIAEVVQRESED